MALTITQDIVVVVVVVVVVAAVVIAFFPCLVGVAIIQIFILCLMNVPNMKTAKAGSVTKVFAVFVYAKLLRDGISFINIKILKLKNLLRSTVGHRWHPKQEKTRSFGPYCGCNRISITFHVASSSTTLRLTLFKSKIDLYHTSPVSSPLLSTRPNYVQAGQQQTGKSDTVS